MGLQVAGALSNRARRGRKRTVVASPPPIADDDMQRRGYLPVAPRRCADSSERIHGECRARLSQYPLRSESRIAADWRDGPRSRHYAVQPIAALFNHYVGRDEKVLRYRDAKGLGGFKVENEV